MTNPIDLIPMFERIYLPGFERSVERVRGARLRTKAAGFPMRYVMAIPLFESLSWAFALVEGLGELSKPGLKLSWINSSADEHFVEAIRYAANKTKHDLLQAVDPSLGFIAGIGLPGMSAGAGEWLWRKSLVPSDPRDANYVCELGGQPVHETLVRLEPILKKGVQKFSPP